MAKFEQKWVRKIGTNRVFVMTVAFVDRLGVDMVEVSAKQAAAIRAEGEQDAKRNAAVERNRKAQEAYDARQKAGPIPTLSEPGEPIKPPETAEEAEARIDAAGGDEGPGMTDGLDEMTAKELGVIIDAEELGVNRKPKKATVIAAIRAAREAKADTGPDAE